MCNPSLLNLIGCLTTTPLKAVSSRGRGREHIRRGILTSPGWHQEYITPCVVALRNFYKKKNFFFFFFKCIFLLRRDSGGWRRGNVSRPVTLQPSKRKGKAKIPQARKGKKKKKGRGRGMKGKYSSHVA